MKNVQTFNEFVNESVVNENIRKLMSELLSKIAATEKEFPKKNKRSDLMKQAKRNKDAETFDQDTKFTYSPDGEVFVVYGYENQQGVDDALYQVKGKNHDVDKAKEKLVLQDAPYGVYAETGRPGYRVFNNGTKHKIDKNGRQKY